MVSIPETGEATVSASPVSAGENVTTMVQLPPGATTPQSFVCANCVFETDTLVTASVLPPVLVTVTDSGGDVVPIDCPPKSIALGYAETWGPAGGKPPMNWPKLTGPSPTGTIAAM